MLVEVKQTFKYSSFSIIFRKEFEMDFPPFYDMVLLDRTSGSSVKIEFSNKGRVSTEIIYTPNRGLLKYQVDTTMTWDEPVRSFDKIEDMLCAFIDCGWEPADSNDIEGMEKAMKEHLVRIEEYLCKIK